MSALATLLSFALFEPPAASEPVSLRWHSECVERAQAIVRLRELIPELPEQVPEQQGEIAVAVEITGTKAQVRFVSSRGIDERTLEGQSCESLAEAVILVIAVAVEASVTTEATVEPDEEQVPEEHVPEQPVDEETVQPPADEVAERSITPPPDEPASEPRTRRARGHVGLLGGGGFGPIDAGVGVLTLEVGAHGRGWRASARATWVIARTIALADPPTSVGRYDGGLAGVRACVVPPLARAWLEVPVCAGIEAGVLRGQGIGATPDPNTATQPWAAVELGPGLRFIPNRWVALGLELDLVASLLRGGFTIGGAVAQRHAAIGVRALAGVEIHFP